jgi:PPP family 3-phenylpropionic acid transporter
VSEPAPLPRFLALYGGLFAAFGVAAPFLPALLERDGLGADQLAIVLAGGTAIRLLTGPAGGRLADRVARPSLVLAGFAAISAAVATCYAPARGLLLLLLVSLAHAAVLAPLTPVADALALGSAALPGGFPYGWVRGAGSAAFIAGTLVAGQLVDRFGLQIIIWLNAGLLAVAAGCSALVPDRLAGSPAVPAARGGVRALLGIPVFVRLMGVAALVGGSHALHDSFEVIRWRAAGLSPAQCSVLWALAVAAEVFVFLFAGRRLLDRLGPAGSMTLAAAAGVLRWSAAACTAAFPVMAAVEPLQGLTFALLHLSCMAVIARHVPRPLAATAQAFYATIAMGAVAAVVTLASGPLYGGFGAGAFWPMAAMCAAALPLARSLRPAAASAGLNRVMP